MISEAGASELLAIADELLRASLVDRRDPERPYMVRGELVRRIRDAVAVERRPPPRLPSVSWPILRARS